MLEFEAVKLLRKREYYEVMSKMVVLMKSRNAHLDWIRRPM